MKMHGLGNTLEVKKQLSALHLPLAQYPLLPLPSPSDNINIHGRSI
jgi:hypothetical protein